VSVSVEQKRLGRPGVGKGSFAFSNTDTYNRHRTTDTNTNNQHPLHPERFKLYQLILYLTASVPIQSGASSLYP
jgi:hypothetical protein